MTHYVWSAKNQKGKTVHQDAPAETLDESKAWMLSEGFTDLVLVEDEVMALAAKGFPEKTFFMGEELKPTAEQRKRGREQPPITLLRLMLESFRDDKRIYLLVLILSLYFGWRGNILGIILSWAGLVGWLMFRYWVAAPLLLYNKINVAKDWCRWSEVSDLLDKVEKLQKRHFIKLPASELIKIRAQILAGTGRLPEALVWHQQCENNPDCPSWMFNSRVSDLYNLAKQYDAGHQYSLQAARESPTTTIFLDVANHYLRRTRNVVAAREALAKVDAESIPKFARYFIHRCHGILAYLERDDTRAKGELETALKMVEANKVLPFRDGSLAILKAYLACVCGRQGEVECGRKYFSESHSYLIATEETELINECKTLLGI